MPIPPSPGSKIFNQANAAYKKRSEELDAELLRASEIRISAQLSSLQNIRQISLAVAAFWVSLGALWMSGNRVEGGMTHYAYLAFIPMIFGTMAGALGVIAVNPELPGCLLGSKGPMNDAKTSSVFRAELLNYYRDAQSRNDLYLKLMRLWLSFSVLGAIFVGVVIASMERDATNPVRPPYLEGKAGDRSPVSPLMCGTLFVICDTQAWADKQRLEQASPAERKKAELEVERRLKEYEVWQAARDKGAEPH